MTSSGISSGISSSDCAAILDLCSKIDESVVESKESLLSCSENDPLEKQKALLTRNLQSMQDQATYLSDLLVMLKNQRNKMLASHGDSSTDKSSKEEIEQDTNTTPE